MTDPNAWWVFHAKSVISISQSYRRQCYNNSMPGGVWVLGSFENREVGAYVKGTVLSCLWCENYVSLRFPRDRLHRTRTTAPSRKTCSTFYRTRGTSMILLYHQSSPTVVREYRWLNVIHRRRAHKNYNNLFRTKRYSNMCHQRVIWLVKIYGNVTCGKPCTKIISRG